LISGRVEPDSIHTMGCRLCQKSLIVINKNTVNILNADLEYIT